MAIKMRPGGSIHGLSPPTANGHIQTIALHIPQKTKYGTEAWPHRQIPITGLIGEYSKSGSPFFLVLFVIRTHSFREL